METVFDYHTFEYDPDKNFGMNYKIYGFKGEEKTLVMAAKNLKAVFKAFPELAKDSERNFSPAYNDLKKRFCLVAYDREKLLEVICELGALVDKRHLSKIKKVIMSSTAINIGLETGNILETDVNEAEFIMLKRGESID